MSEETSEDNLIVLPILDRMSAPQKVVGKVTLIKSELPDFPDFCLALGFNRTGVTGYIPRVFVVIDDATYLDHISRLNLTSQMLIEKAKESGGNDASKAD